MSSRKARVKKMNIKTMLAVFREDQIDPFEYEALTTDVQIKTGVDDDEITVGLPALRAPSDIT